MLNTKKNKICYKILSCAITIIFLISNVYFPGISHAQNALNLPSLGTMITTSPAYNPPIIQGITIYPEDPMKLDFIISPGQETLEGEAFNTEAYKLIKYFMASFTVPEQEMWVTH